MWSLKTNQQTNGHIFILAEWKIVFKLYKYYLGFVEQLLQTLVLLMTWLNLQLPEFLPTDISLSNACNFHHTPVADNFPFSILYRVTFIILLTLRKT